MGIKVFVTILLSTILINNFVLTRFLGLCPFLGVSRKLDSAVSMGLAVMFVMTLTSFITYPIYAYVLAPNGIAYLATLVFILVIACLVQFVDMAIRKISPALYQSPGIFLPLITTNCAVLGVALLNISPGFFELNAGTGLLASVVQGFGAGAGFTLVLVIMAGIQERLELADVPENLKGAPIAFITAGLLALAFFGFSGMKI